MESVILVLILLLLSRPVVTNQNINAVFLWLGAIHSLNSHNHYILLTKYANVKGVACGDKPQNYQLNLQLPSASRRFRVTFSSLLSFPALSCTINAHSMVFNYSRQLFSAKKNQPVPYLLSTKQQTDSYKLVTKNKAKRESILDLHAQRGQQQNSK